MRRNVSQAISSCLFIALVSINIAHAAMSTPVQVGVSPSGAAVSTIPIQVPPGTAGLEPKLSLNYNSQSGNGLLGVGWSLGGLSVIGRCQQTVAQDGVRQDGLRGGINLDANDRFCLDGQRLILISGIYGENGAEYRTERDAFSRIQSFGTAGNGPAWFKVSTKSGQVMEYGNTEDSRIQSQGKATARAWALNRVQDSNSNYLTVGYIEDSVNGDYYPARIDYTGNVTTNTPTNNSVLFVYEPKTTDVTRVYFAGSQIQSSVRISHIKTYSSTNPVKDYQLTYNTSPSSQRSRIARIAECKGDGVTCLPATTMSWKDGNTNLTVPDYNLPVLPGKLPVSGAVAYNGTYPVLNQVGDFNGDGKMDFMWAPQNGDARWLIAYGTATGFTLPDYNAPVLPGKLANGMFNSNAGTPHFMQFGDFNGDGKMDYLFIPPSSDGRWLIAYGTDTGFTQPDYNRPVLPGTLPISGKVTNNSNAFGIRVGDFNGDGRMDLMWMPQNGDGRWLIAYGTDTGLTLPDYNNPVLPAKLSNGVLTAYGGAPQLMQFGDFNGDGKLDYLFSPQGGDGRWLIAYGTDTGLTLPDYNAPVLPAALPGSAAVTPGSGFKFIGDFNGDGKADYLWVPQNGDGRWLIAYGTGNGFTLPDYNSPALPAQLPSGIKTSASAGQVRFGDFNGDGKTDLMFVPYYGTDYRWIIAYGTDTGFTIPDYNSPAIPPTIANTPGYPFVHAGLPHLMQTGDFNGDGKTDFMVVPQNSDGRRIMVTANSSAANLDLLISVTSGFGATTTLAYKQLINSVVYTKDSGSVYPQRDVQTPQYVVSSIVSPDGIGGTLTTNYTYGGLKVDQSGRGLLGFRWTQAVQQETGLTSRTEYRQDWPYTGMLLNLNKTRVGYGNNGVLSQLANSYGCTDFVNNTSDCHLSANKRYFPYVKSQTQVNWDLDGTALPTATSTFVYDYLNTDTQTWPDLSQIYGNLTQSIVIASDGYSTTTNNTYNNDTGNWFIGQLMRTTVTKTSP
jgi:hypothetical protein